MRPFIQFCTFMILLVTTCVHAAGTDYDAVMQRLIEKGDQQVASYDPKQALEQGKAFSNLYFGGFEGMGLELAVGQASQDAMLNIEMQFSQLINAAMKGEAKQVIEAKWQTLRVTLVDAPLMENHSSYSTIIQSFLILLREGAEAMLVVAALITYLRRSGSGDQTYWIWGGVAAALLLSALTAWVIQAVIKLQSGAIREMIEGSTMLVAACLLSYVSVWLYARREMSKWRTMIDHQLGEALNRGRRWTLVSIAFLAVYREGAETVLFYQALVTNAAGQMNDIYIGIGLAVVALIAVYGLIVFASIKLPIKLFFSASAGLLYLLSIVFTGKAILELQVAGTLSINEISGPTVSWLGIFPTLESLSAQICMACLPFLINYLAQLCGQSARQSHESNTVATSKG
jgi:high-affinity iron transporter